MSRPAIELRELPAPCTVNRQGKSAYLDGVLPYFSLSENLGGFREQIAPGAFKRTLNARSDVKAFWAHDTTEILGSTAAGTMTLEDRADGLHFSIRMPESSAHRVETVERGDCPNVSFGFQVDPKGDEWNLEGPETIRTLRSVHLLEISPGTAYAAYESAYAEANHRSLPDASGTLDAMRAEIDFYS